MEFQEFPKGLCIGGAEGVWRIAMNRGEEDAARADGFTPLSEQAQGEKQAAQDPPKEAAERKKPGPKPKAAPAAGDKQ